MAMSYTPLPYDFDLLYDIKTVEQLHDHLTGRHRQATSATDQELYAMCVEYGIPLPTGLIIKLDHPYKLAALPTSMHLGLPREKTLRDEFAMAAMQGVLTGNGLYTFADIATDAYALADAMLKAREQSCATSTQAPATGAGNPSQ